VRKIVLVLFALASVVLLGVVLFVFSKRQQPAPSSSPAPPKSPLAQLQEGLEAGGERRKAVLDTIGHPEGPSLNDAMPVLLAALEKATRRGWQGDQESKELLAVIERVGASAVPELRKALAEDEYCRAALLFLAQLGPTAEPALPEIYARYLACPDAVPDREVQVDAGPRTVTWQYRPIGKPCPNVSAELCRRVLERIGPAALRFLAARPWHEEAAAEALVQFGKPALRFLVRESPISGPDDTIELALARLARIGPIGEEEIHWLIEEVRRGTPEASRRAGGVLVRVGERSVLPLLQMMEDPAPEKKENEGAVCNAGFFLLAKIGPPALPQLYTAFDQKEIRRRRNAIQAIGVIAFNRGYRPEPKLVSQAVPAMRAALRDEDALIRSVAAAHLAYAAGDKDLAPIVIDAIPDLAGALSDKDAYVRGQSALGLACFGASAKSAVPELQKALDDPTPLVRFWAAFALCGRVGDKRELAEPVLLALFRSGPVKTGGGTFGSVSWAAGMVLAESPAGEKHVTPVVREMLSGIQKFDDDRLGGVSSLLAVLGPRGVAVGPQLLTLLERDDELALWASLSLINMGPEEREKLGPALRKLMAGEKPRPRWYAFLALASIDPEEARKAFPEASAVVAALSADGARRRPRLVARSILTANAYFVPSSLETWECGYADPVGLDYYTPLLELKATRRETGMLLTGLWADRPDFTGSNEFTVISRCRGAAAEAVAPLLVEMLLGAREHQRNDARKVLVGMGNSAIPALRAALKSKAPGAVIITLGLIGPEAKDAVPDLIPLLTAKDEALPAKAAETLGRIGPAAKAALPNLIAAFKKESNDALRPAAIQAVGRIGKDGVPLLIEALKHPDALVRASSAEALGRIGPDAKPAVPHLLMIRDNENEEASVRQAAEKALEPLDPK
jgi:HEAT repeat protein